MLYQEITLPDENDLFFIGDIHGQWDEYNSVLRSADVKETDFLVSVGDLIDRGPKNTKCLMEFLTNPRRLMVLGNHEELMMKAIYSRDHYHCWYFNGGDVTLDEIGEGGMIAFSEMLKDIPIALEISHRNKKYLVVHAGVREEFSDVEVLKQLINKRHVAEGCLWDRDTIEKVLKYPDVSNIIPPVVGVDFAIHGHTGTDGVLNCGNRYWIDTKYRQGTLTIAKATQTGFDFYNELEVL